MTSAICTLFEGDYHYGVGSLCNSLYARGFRGVVYAGYRGALPPWAAAAENKNGYAELVVAPQFLLRFVPLTTKVHFTHCKPDFMLTIWRDFEPDADALFYFDPDITLICRWSFLEEWVMGGVALCSDVNPQMPPTHPLRHAWLRFFAVHGVHVTHEQSIYFNGGFIGVTKAQAGFLKQWQRLLQLIADTAGGLRNITMEDRTFLFHVPDQDALNVASMTCDEPISCVGQDGMDLQWGGGGYIMTHALGGGKPWRKKMFWTTLTTAHRPSRADKAFLAHVDSPIRLYGPAALRLKKLDMLAASAVGRYIG